MHKRLLVTTLGDLTFQLDGETVSVFSSRKAEALLVYLGVEKKYCPPVREPVHAALIWCAGGVSP